MSLMFVNPIDLARIFVVMKMDIAVLMGYTGAVFKEFLYGNLGNILSIASLLLWITVPSVAGYLAFRRKNW